MPADPIPRVLFYVAVLFGLGHGLRGDEDFLALVVESLADGLLRLAALVAFGGVEVVDAAFEGVADGLGAAGAIWLVGQAF